MSLWRLGCTIARKALIAEDTYQYFQIITAFSFRDGIRKRMEIVVFFESLLVPNINVIYQRSWEQILGKQQIEVQKCSNRASEAH